MGKYKSDFDWGFLGVGLILDADHSLKTAPIHASCQQPEGLFFGILSIGMPWLPPFPKPGSLPQLPEECWCRSYYGSPSPEDPLTAGESPCGSISQGRISANECNPFIDKGL